MIPPPTALGLFLCERVLVDKESGNPSPIGIFTGLAVDQFPSDPQRFSVFSALTDGAGNGNLELAAVRLDTGEQFYSQKHPVHFPDRGIVVNIHVRVRKIVFPSPGWFEMLLLIDNDLIAQRKVRVYQAPAGGTG
jgi:hypothetical protein